MHGPGTWIKPYGIFLLQVNESQATTYRHLEIDPTSIYILNLDRPGNFYKCLISTGHLHNEGAEIAKQ